jgi:hypothetical protein
VTTYPWASVDYELDWPAELVVTELLALMNRPYRSWTGSEVELLLREAFHTDVPATDFARLHDFAEWDNDPAPTRQWISDLVGNVEVLRPYTPPRPYWAQRQASVTPRASPDRTAALQRFADLVSHLSAHGYFDREFSAPCVLSDEHHGRDLNSELLQRLGHPGPGRVWPLRPDGWDPVTFYSLIEIFHDLVARPRSRWEHDDVDCGPHFHDFEIEAGRRVYRALVNQLLTEHGVELRLATEGEDEGRLVRLVDASRADLIDRVRRTPSPAVAGPVDHAIALFRGRDATEHDKRSAVVALANVLEDRRQLLKETLFTDDEGALFTIANRFDLRHRNDKQHTNYDPAFRDWVFWWYLATIELTERILARQRTQVSATTT